MYTKYCDTGSRQYQFSSHVHSFNTQPDYALAILLHLPDVVTCSAYEDLIISASCDIPDIICYDNSFAFHFHSNASKGLFPTNCITSIFKKKLFLESQFYGENFLLVANVNEVSECRTYKSTFYNK